MVSINATFWRSDLWYPDFLSPRMKNLSVPYKTRYMFFIRTLQQSCFIWHWPWKLLYMLTLHIYTLDQCYVVKISLSESHNKQNMNIYSWMCNCKKNTAYIMSGYEHRAINNISRQRTCTVNSQLSLLKNAYMVWAAIRTPRSGI